MHRYPSFIDVSFTTKNVRNTYLVHLQAPSASRDAGEEHGKWGYGVRGRIAEVAPWMPLPTIGGRSLHCGLGRTAVGGGHSATLERSVT